LAQTTTITRTAAVPRDPGSTSAGGGRSHRTPFYQQVFRRPLLRPGIQLTSRSPAIIKVGWTTALTNLLPPSTAACWRMSGPGSAMKELQHVQKSPSATTTNDTREQAKESMFGPDSLRAILRWVWITCAHGKR